MGNGELIPVALAYAAAGLSVIPVKADKTPLIKWEPLQERILTTPEIQEHWKNGAMLAIGCGPISGNLEVMDFDCPERDGVAEAWDDFKKIVADHGETELWEKLLRIQTPSGGWHLCYRHNGAPQRNLKLAYNVDNKITIETRGDGGYVMTAPSTGYRVSHGDWLSLPTLTEDEHEFLLNAARFLDEGQTKRIEHPRGVAAITRPGDAFNLNGEDCATQLMNAGWKPCKGKSGGLGGNLFTRPGKEHGPSASVTTNGSLVYVYTSNAYPLEAGKAYTRFTLYAALNFKGDFSMAARDLASKGFGASNIQQQTNQERIYVTKDQTPEPDVFKRKRFGNNFVVEDVEFIWEPFLPIGRMVLNDADGGTGKTSLAIAIAAAFSNGVIPGTTQKCEPINTLYLHSGEDTSEDMEAIYRACGGRAGRIEYIEGAFSFNAKGIQTLYDLIVETESRFIPIDALFYYLLGVARDTNSALDILPIMRDLQQVYQETKSCGWHIRHTKKGAVGTQASELGMGTVQFRNSHRGQLVARWHPEERGVVVVTDEKGSLRVQRGDPFAYRRIGDSIEFVQLDANPFGSVSTNDTPSSMVEIFLRENLSEETLVSSRVITEKAQRAGINTGGGTWKRIKRDMTTAVKYSDGWYVALKEGMAGA